MHSITRRNALATFTGTLLTVVVRAHSPTPSSVPRRRLITPFKEGRWGLSSDDPTMGVAAGIMDLDDQISTFFGNAVGRYLTDQVIYPDTALPGWQTTERPVYDQFSAIYKGWAEFDATLTNGVRMVARN